MLLSIKVNNCFIYNRETEFSMRANMRYRRFKSNVASIDGINVLKSAVLIGPNNSGKTNVVRIIYAVKEIMLGKENILKGNLFSGNPVTEICVSFLDDVTEYSFEIRYDVTANEYLYERFARVERDKYKNIKTVDLLLRDCINNKYYSVDNGLDTVMRVASRNNILIHLINTDSFPGLGMIKDAVLSFASKIEIVDMNNIPISKTIEMLKRSEADHRKIADFVINADLYLDDFRYLSDEELSINLDVDEIGEKKPQENALSDAAPLTEMLHLASFYKGIPVFSLLFDSTGTKKMEALASYVIDAIENGRILIIDELDSSLHFRLTRAIIALFNNELNRKAQLIATVHDISLLDCQSLFRKEQLWFTHKDRENAYLYSLADFTTEKTGVRGTSDLIEMYRKGVFGALPEPDLFKSLMDIVYSDQEHMIMNKQMKKYKESLAKTPGPVSLEQLKERVDIRALDLYAREQGKRPSELTEEEKRAFVFSVE